MGGVQPKVPRGCEEFGPSCEDSKHEDWRLENQWGNWLTRIYLENGQ